MFQSEIAPYTEQPTSENVRFLAAMNLTITLLIAQTTSLDGAMSEGLGIIAKFLYIIAVIVIAHGGWQVRSGNADMGKMSIVGGLLLGLAVVIADALFSAGGMPTIQIAP
jgi:hypothetical protein